MSVHVARTHMLGSLVQVFYRHAFRRVSPKMLSDSVWRTSRALVDGWRILVGRLRVAYMFSAVRHDSVAKLRLCARVCPSWFVWNKHTSSHHHKIV